MLIHPRVMSIRRLFIVTTLVTTLLVSQAIAADQVQKVEAADSKAGALEQNVAAEDRKVLPSPSESITEFASQAVDPVGEDPWEEAITCLSQTLYMEARGEGTAGMETVANVVMNRLDHKGFPNNICEIVRQGRGQGACQFSSWCDGSLGDIEEDITYSIAMEIARNCLNGQLTDRTDGALYFHQRAVTPSWSAEYIKTVKVGEHVFYRPHGGRAK